MDPRDLALIKKYGIDHVKYLHDLVADPTLNILDQIRFSEQINRIKNRANFRSKSPITIDNNTVNSK